MFKSENLKENFTRDTLCTPEGIRGYRPWAARAFGDKSWYKLPENTRQALIQVYGEPIFLDFPISIVEEARGEHCADNERAFSSTMHSVTLEGCILLFGLYGRVGKMRAIPKRLVVGKERGILLPDHFYTLKGKDRRAAWERAMRLIQVDKAASRRVRLYDYPEEKLDTGEKIHSNGGLVFSFYKTIYLSHLGDTGLGTRLKAEGINFRENPDDVYTRVQEIVGARVDGLNVAHIEHAFSKPGNVFILRWPAREHLFLYPVGLHRPEGQWLPATREDRWLKAVTIVDPNSSLSEPVTVVEYEEDYYYYHGNLEEVTAEEVVVEA